MQENPKSPASLSATSAAAALVVVRGHVRTCPIPCIGRSERQRSDRLGNARATARAQTRNGNRLPRRSEAAKALVRSLPRCRITQQLYRCSFHGEASSDLWMYALRGKSNVRFSKTTARATLFDISCKTWSYSDVSYDLCRG
jgi:hypothetical protein